MLACLRLPPSPRMCPCASPHVRQKLKAQSVTDEIVIEVSTPLNTTRADLHWDELRGDEDRHSAVEHSYVDLCDYAYRPLGSVGSSEGVAAAAGEGSPGQFGNASDLSRASTLLTEEREDATPDEYDDAAQSQDESDSRDEVQDWDGVQDVARRFVQGLRLRPHEVGSRNYSRWRGRTLWNQCFYMSMAFAYLGNKASCRRVRGLARRMRRAIEAVVLEKHPSWAQGLAASTSGTGKAMVFADFLPLAMRSDSISMDRNLLAKLVVCIVDSVNGHAEAYVGPGYHQLEDRAEQAKNFLLLWYKPGHYQVVVCDDAAGSKLDCTYDEFKELLIKHDVVFIETTE
mmetsp:Transcript_56287/g.163199  ORF Transcript_56287/g.163199 Transcript_56287/m.163199 type:complete len:343 (-) Transcript_56287:105-1133(-)